MELGLKNVLAANLVALNAKSNSYNPQAEFAKKCYTTPCKCWG